MCVNQRNLTTGSCDWLVPGKSPKWYMCEACKELKGHNSWSTIGQKYSLARQLAPDSFQLWGWVAKMLCLDENWFFTFLTYTTINTFIPTKCRELLERNPKEKQDWLIHILHHLILQIPLLSPSLLTYPWKVHFAKSLSHHTRINKEVFWCLGSSSEMTNLLGWCNGLIAGSGKLKKIRLGVTLLEQEVWKA